MTVFFHELKRGRLSLIIWTAAISFMLAVTILIFPQMKPQMDDMDKMVANMGTLSSAFGMDKMGMSEFINYFALECGNILGLGGALFAALLGVSALAKEEKEHTAEFLYTLPLSRSGIVLQKLLAVAVQIIILDIFTTCCTLGCIYAIGESVEAEVMLPLMLSYLLLQLETAMLCFGISAFLRGNGLGLGLGLALGLYFLNLISNITEDAKALKYITPFSYAEGSDIIANHSIEPKYLAAGTVMSALAVAAAFLKYRKKDLAA